MGCIDRIAGPGYFTENRVPAHSDHRWFARAEEASRASSSFEQSLDGVGELVAGDDGLLRPNGRRVVMRGVNRHEFGLDGRVVGREQTERDIVLLNQDNVNAVRTSHHANNSWFHELCDQYGLVVVDEMNLETHGLWGQTIEGRRAIADQLLLASQYARPAEGRPAEVEELEHTVRVTFHQVLPTVPASECAVTDEVGDDGRVAMTVVVQPGEGLSDMPEFGSQLAVDADLSRLRWYRAGPHESYVGRRASARPGVWEAGNHTGLRWAEVTDLHGPGLRLECVGEPMEFSALPWTPPRRWRTPCTTPNCPGAPHRPAAGADATRRRRQLPG